MPRWRSLAAAVLVVAVSTALDAQNPTPLPRVELVTAPPVVLTGEVDSNSAVVWERIDGRDTMFVVTSANGRPQTAFGHRIELLGAAQDVEIEPWPGGGVWMEAVIPGVDGTWYGYYHNEVNAPRCGGSDKVVPRIGAARSRDQGRSWEPLGVVLEARAGSIACVTPNEYFLGGVGDFSVLLDPTARDLYFFYSQYSRALTQQGVSVARLAWADRNAPTGKIMVWRGRTWVPASSTSAEGALTWTYPLAVPVLPATNSWHDNDSIVDAFWGPGVHWNTYLQQYVMLLNRAKDPSWTQEGIYVSYAPRLDDPRLWSVPVKIIETSGWYPQVVGIELGTGTDKVAGQRPRLFVHGVSRHWIQFNR